MAIEKRVPMVGSMQKMASEDIINEPEVETVTVKDDDWELTIPKGLYDEVGEGTIVALMSMTMYKLKLETS